MSQSQFDSQSQNKIDMGKYGFISTNIINKKEEGDKPKKPPRLEKKKRGKNLK